MDAVLRNFTVMMVFHTDCGQDDPVSPGSGRIAFRGVGWSAGGRIPVCIEGFPDRNLVIVPVGCRPAEKNVRAIFSGLHPHGKAWCRGRGFQKQVPGRRGNRRDATRLSAFIAPQIFPVTAFGVPLQYWFGFPVPRCLRHGSSFFSPVGSG